MPPKRIIKGFDDLRQVLGGAQQIASKPIGHNLRVPDDD